jgi:hypothetical protein
MLKLLKLGIFSPKPNPAFGKMPSMNFADRILKRAMLCLACASLVACAGPTAGERMADMPQWLGGEPAGVPPRRGTPEYDAWAAARAEEAARPKTDQPKQ